MSKIELALALGWYAVILAAFFGFVLWTRRRWK